MKEGGNGRKGERCRRNKGRRNERMGEGSELKTSGGGKWKDGKGM